MEMEHKHFLSTGQTDFLPAKFASYSTLTRFDLWLRIFVFDKLTFDYNNNLSPYFIVHLAKSTFYVRLAETSILAGINAAGP